MAAKIIPEKISHWAGWEIYFKEYRSGAICLWYKSFSVFLAAHGYLTVMFLRTVRSSLSALVPSGKPVAAAAVAEKLLKSGFQELVPLLLYLEAPSEGRRGEGILPYQMHLLCLWASRLILHVWRGSSRRSEPHKTQACSLTSCCGPFPSALKVSHF